MTDLDPTTFRAETQALHSGQKPDPTTSADGSPDRPDAGERFVSERQGLEA